MTHAAVMEMVCDWQGAGRAQGVAQWWDVRPWYEANKDKILLHKRTRQLVETMI